MPPPADAESPPPGVGAGASGRRRWARALGDGALVEALASGDAAVWAEFDARFRPLLERYARRVGIPTAWWPQCVDEVLEDEAMRLGDGGEAPTRLGPYLVRAAYHRLLKLKRAAARRDRRYAADALDGARGPHDDERVVRALCSSASLRASDGLPVDEPPAGPPGGGTLARAARVLAARCTEDERQLLVWVAAQVPRRQIAEWVGDGYEATRKRIHRLVRRLQAEAFRHAATLPPAEREELERAFRRAGATAGTRRAHAASDLPPRAAPRSPPPPRAPSAPAAPSAGGPPP